MPDKKKQNLFTRLTLGAAMAENPAVMQASGWTSDPANGVQMGDRDAPGNEQLRENLTQIASMPLTDMGMELAFPYILRGAKAGANAYRQGRNFVKSRYIMKNLAKAEEAGDFNAFYHNPGPNDIQGLSYFMDSGPAARVKRVGRSVTVQETPKSKPYTDKMPTVQDAIDAETYARTHSYAPGFKDSREVMAQIAKDAASLRSGDKVSLITDGALSKDSYPLLQKILLKNQRNGTGQLAVVKDGNIYRMIELNDAGINPSGIDNLDAAIESLRKTLNDQNIPGRISIMGKHYVPAIEFTKFKKGGCL